AGCNHPSGYPTKRQPHDPTKPDARPLSRRDRRPTGYRLWCGAHGRGVSRRHLGCCAGVPYIRGSTRLAATGGGCRASCRVTTTPPAEAGGAGGDRLVVARLLTAVVTAPPAGAAGVCTARKPPGPRAARCAEHTCDGVLGWGCYQIVIMWRRKRPWNKICYMK